jgi:hypothetical protein
LGAGHTRFVGLARGYRLAVKQPPPRGASPQPGVAETESARVLANQARDDLSALGYTEDEIRRMANEFVAAGLEGTEETFVRWVRENGRIR